jgi:hypothetical protein
MNFFDRMLNGIYDFLFSDGHISTREFNLDNDLRIGQPLGIRFDVMGLGDSLTAEQRRLLMKSGWTQECIARTLADVMHWCKNNLKTDRVYLQTGVAIPYSLATGVLVLIPMQNSNRVTYRSSSSFYASAISALVSQRFRAHAMSLRPLFPLEFSDFDEIFGMEELRLPYYDTTVRIFEFGRSADDPEEYLEFVREVAYDFYAETLLETVCDEEERERLIEEDQVDLAEQEDDGMIGIEGESNSDEEENDLEEIIRTWIIVKPSSTARGVVTKRVEDLEELWHRYSWDTTTETDDDDSDYEPSTSCDEPDEEFDSGSVDMDDLPPLEDDVPIGTSDEEEESSTSIEINLIQ